MRMTIDRGERDSQNSAVSVVSADRRETGRDELLPIVTEHVVK